MSFFRNPFLLQDRESLHPCPLPKLPGSTWTWEGTSEHPRPERMFPSDSARRRGAGRLCLRSSVLADDTPSWALWSLPPVNQFSLHRHRTVFITKGHLCPDTLPGTSSPFDHLVSYKCHLHVAHPGSVPAKCPPLSAAVPALTRPAWPPEAAVTMARREGVHCSWRPCGLPCWSLFLCIYCILPRGYVH